MDLLELANAVNAAGKQNEVVLPQSFLVYGLPKTGKTELVATLAMAPEFDTIYWFDLENGASTLLRMHKEGKLTDAAMKKIIYIKIPDTRTNPVGIQTLLKTIAGSSPVNICVKHGACGCSECTREGLPSVEFHYQSLTPRSAIVVDSMSQAGDSALNLACAGKPAEYKPLLDDYGSCGKWLGDVCTVIQAAQYCPIFCITHADIEKDPLGNERITPICGSSKFSGKVAKYFGTVIYLEKKLGAHKATSTTLANTATLAGSRIGVVLDKQTKLNLADALREAGYFGQVIGVKESSAPAAAKQGGIAALLNK